MQMVRSRGDYLLNRSVTKRSRDQPAASRTRIRQRLHLHLAILRPSEVDVLRGVPKNEQISPGLVSKENWPMAFRGGKRPPLTALLPRSNQLNFQFTRITSAGRARHRECEYCQRNDPRDRKQKRRRVDLAMGLDGGAQGIQYDLGYLRFRQ